MPPCASLKAFVLIAVLLACAGPARAETSHGWIVTILFEVDGRPVRIATDPAVIHASLDDCERVKARQTATLRQKLAYMFASRPDCQRREIR